jgi:hypothetical protein
VVERSFEGPWPRLIHGFYKIPGVSYDCR